MKNYEQVLKRVELALANGEYNFCIEFLSPIIESFPLSSKQGVNLRTILITALCGVNKKEEAKKLCKELLKSYELKTREDAKYLMEIIDSPEIKKPDNWNINFESNLSSNKKSNNFKKLKKHNLEDKKFINTSNNPTGETKPFQKGFTIFIFLILLLLIPLLSGCVHIENTLDLSEIDSINNYLKVESKYMKKLPWQIKFEERIKDIFPNSEIEIGESNFYLKNKNLNFEKTVDTLQIIQNTAGSIAGEKTELEINKKEKNLIFLKKYNYQINANLKNIADIDNLEIIFRIISPNKYSLTNINNSQVEIVKNLLIWRLLPGEKNILEFSFLAWNQLLICSTLVITIILSAYLIRVYRLRLGTDLPQLPPN
jgi:hypothetical protein